MAKLKIDDWFKKYQASPYYFWNDGLAGSFMDNSFPQIIANQMFGHWVMQVMERKTNLLYGKGLIVGYDNDFSKEGQRKALENNELKKFMRGNTLNQTFRSWVLNSNIYGDVFPQIIKNGFGKIAALTCKASGYYRKSKDNQYAYAYDFYSYFNYGMVASLYPLESLMDKIRMIDTEEVFSILDEIDNSNDSNIILRTGIADGLMGYARPASQGLYTYKNKWLEVSKSIPDNWQAFRKNFAAPASILEIPVEFMNSKYPDWESLSKEQRQELLSKEGTDYDNLLAGNRNVGKTLRFLTYPSDNNQKERLKPTFQFVVAEVEKYTDGLVSQRKESASEILAILGVPMALQDVVPKSDSIVPSSGEATNAAYENFVRENRFLVETFLKILEVVRDYNQWDEKICFDVEYLYKFDSNLTNNLNEPNI